MYDWDRPIINFAQISPADCSTVTIRGFNVARSNVIVYAIWHDQSMVLHQDFYHPIEIDQNWGKLNQRSYLMGQIVIRPNWKCESLCPNCQIALYAKLVDKQSYHPFYVYLQPARMEQ